MTINEDALESQTLIWLASLGYATAHGPDLAPA